MALLIFVTWQGNGSVEGHVVSSNMGVIERQLGVDKRSRGRNAVVGRGSPTRAGVPAPLDQGRPCGASSRMRRRVAARSVHKTRYRASLPSALPGLAARQGQMCSNDGQRRSRFSALGHLGSGVRSLTAAATPRAASSGFSCSQTRITVQPASHRRRSVSASRSRLRLSLSAQ